MELEEDDEISKQMRKDGDRIGWRFSKTFLLLFAVYEGAQIMHWLFDLPHSMSRVESLVGWIGALIVLGFGGSFAELLILEYRLRSQCIDQKVVAIESRLVEIAATLKIEDTKDTGKRKEAEANEKQQRDKATLVRYRAAAERDETWGQHKLGVVYSNGELVPHDRVQAAYWYRKAADEGDTCCQLYLADLLAGGRGIDPDYPEAVRLYQLVSEAGHVYSPSADYSLGKMYASGKGVAQDYVEAVKYWKRAAEHGWDVARWELDDLYERGADGFPQSFTEAYFWRCVSASSQKNQELIEYRIAERDRIVAYLTPESMHQMQERAQLWLQGDHSVAGRPMSLI